MHKVREGSGTLLNAHVDYAQDAVVEQVEQLNRDPTIDGILVQVRAC